MHSRASIVSTVIVLSIMGGCIPSLHPYYTRDTVVIDDNIEGEWTNNNVHHDNQSSTQMIWKFERAKDFTYKLRTSEHKMKGMPLSGMPEGATELKVQRSDSFYILTLTETLLGQENTIFMTVHATTINDQLFLDFIPNEIKDKNRQSYFASNFIYGHTLSKVEFDDQQMIMKPLNSEYIESLIKHKKIRLMHEKRGDEIVLTAPSEDLRTFISKYMDDPNIFDEPENLFAIR